MIRRTLTALTPALFALPFLLTPASQVYADADGMSSIYSATECKVDADNDEGRTGDARYRTNYNPGGPVPNLKGITNMSDSGDVVVNCPLPHLDPGGDGDLDPVTVTIVDGTAKDNVSCSLRACDGGVGTGRAGTTGRCTQSLWRSSNSDNYADGYTAIVGADKRNHVSDDVDFITFNYQTELATNDTSKENSPFSADLAMMGMPGDDSALVHPDLNPVDFSLVCVIPEQDVDQVGINTHGYSYIQSYAVH